MPSRLRRVLLIVFTFSTIFIFQVLSSSAQSAYVVTLTPPDTSNFPKVISYLDVHDQAGEFIHGLSGQDVTIQENDVQLPVAALVEKKPGVQFVVAITPGASLAIRDASGTTRYEYLLQGLLAGSWVQQSSTGDDLSFLTVGGPQLTHSSDPIALRTSLETVQPTDPNAQPSLEALSAALQVASDPTPRPGMERAILFITPPQPTDVSLGIQSIIANANQQNIHVFVWLVASQEALELPETELLRNLADQTRGTFFAFSHDEPVPDLNTLLEPLRYVYQLSYQSQVAQAGSQQVFAQVSFGGEQFSSQPQSFELDLQSPAVEFQDPPSEIVRKFPDQPTPVTSDSLIELQPMNEQLEIKVVFPDGHSRPLVRTSLFVDEKLAVENTNSPFDQFSWDLRPYTEVSTHTLRIEAEDSLGLIGQTRLIPVKIIVPPTTQEVASIVSQKRTLVIGMTVITSAIILILVLIMGGRIRPKPYPGQGKTTASFTGKASPFGYRDHIRQMRDPLTQPVRISTTTPTISKNRFTGLIARLPWLRQKTGQITILASLIPLPASDEPTLSVPFQMITDVLSLGKDSQKATLVINDPSVEGLHAQIQHVGSSFLITDAGSVSGTWVNYMQVDPGGKLLAHGDIIHLGRVGFLFKLQEPGTLPKVVVMPLEPKQ